MLVHARVPPPQDFCTALQTYGSESQITRTHVTFDLAMAWLALKAFLDRGCDISKLDILG